MKSRVVTLVVGFLFGVATAVAVSVGASPQSGRKAVYAGAKPLGPYTPGIDVGNLVFLSGQIGIDPATGKMVEGGTAEQARQALENLGRILKEAGLGYENVVKTTIFLADIHDYRAVNEVYGSFFPEDSPPPARSTIQVAAIPAGARVEIDFIAAR
ncbi:MAG: Rid family detoxifying hydrolase [Acidobacteriota bacterium]